MQWNTSSTFEQPPVGSHAAVLIRIIDIGTQKSEYQGKPSIRRQNILTWELPNELNDEGKPYIISKFYTASLGEKANLTKDLTSWLGKTPTPPFDPKTLLGKGCQVVVSERENSDKKVVSTVVALPKGMALPKETVNPLIFFSLDEFDEEVFDGLSDGIQQMIMRSPEYDAVINGADDIDQSKPESDDDNIPF